MEKQQKKMEDSFVLSEERILVCLSPSPSNARIVQTAVRMAKAYQCALTALYVKTSSFENLSQEDRKRLQEHIQLAKAEGAVLEQVSGEDIALEIAEFARVNGITKIVVGRSNAVERHLLGRRTLTDELIFHVPNIEIFIIPDLMIDKSIHLKREKNRRPVSMIDFGKMLLSLIGTTVLSLLFYRLGFTDANIVTVYILGVLITSVVTEHMWYGVVASVFSVIIFNYFFTEPRYTLLAYDIGYPMTFLVMFLASLMTGTLAAKLKKLAKQSSEQAYRTKLLLDTNQVLQQAENQDEIWQILHEQLSKLTGRDITIYLPQAYDLEKLLQRGNTERELLFPVRAGNIIYGVLGIDVNKDPMDLFENSIVISILGECALALESERNAREKEQAAILAENEQLRANLLRTISHDLRTPLTSISGNASNLMNHSNEFDQETKEQLYSDIYDDSMWLIALVENLLSVTRMEGEGVNLHYTSELIADVVAEAMRHLDRRQDQHTILIENEDELMMARIDAKLIIQLLINLINNAIKYTQVGSTIRIIIKKVGTNAEIAVSDNGPGIPDDRKNQVFELFYSGEGIIADSHRSMGLGLALCKSIVTAHGGMIHITDSEQGGAEIVFTLPTEEVTINE